MFLDLDVEHHDDEQEQHHHGAHVNEHEHDGQKLRLDEKPDCRARHEAQDEEQRRMHGVLGNDHPERRGHEDRRKDVEQDLDQHVVRLPSPAAGQRYGASAALSTAIMAS